ncbi:methyltransferase family protein [Marinoscillum sp.]|uniref:methyltransferase family protein n=1 Tax=Marinoscillum sp. TaxID=2024838 RepID=UPI003BA88B6E
MISKQNQSNIGNFLFRYRGEIPVLLLVIGLVVRYNHYAAGNLYDSTYDYACLGISLVGFCFRIHAVGYSPRGTSGRNTGQQMATNLNMTGLYSIVRHPLYLANFVIWLPIAMLSYSSLFCIAFLLFFMMFYTYIISVEEEFLSKKFGLLYDEWKNETPAFIPNFTLYSKSYMAFNWKKVLRKEKNGLAAIFTTYFLFQVAHALGSHQSVIIFINENVFWIIMFVLSVVNYLVMKLLMLKSLWVYASNKDQKSEIK